MALLKLDDYARRQPEETLSNPAPVLERMLDWAAENGQLDSNSPVYRDLMDTEIMACLMPRPSGVIYQFRSLYHINRKAATDYFLPSQPEFNYIRTDRVKKDEMDGGYPLRQNGYHHQSVKAGKGPKAIAAARNLKSASYPKCLFMPGDRGVRGQCLPAA